MSTWTQANIKWETQRYSSRIQPRWVVDFFSDFWHVYLNPSLFNSCFCWKKPEIENLTVMQDSSKKLSGNISPNRCFWNKRKRLQVNRGTNLMIKSLYICCIFNCLYPNTDIFYQKKQRRKHSINRNFHSDYIGIDHKYFDIKWENSISS